MVVYLKVIFTESTTFTGKLIAKENPKNNLSNAIITLWRLRK